MAGYGEFELDLEAAFKRDLPPFITTIQDIQLTSANVSATVPASKNGVYVLLKNSQVVYVGKTDARAGFRDRLSRHEQSIQHRVGLNPATITFKAVAIAVFKNADIEQMLIDHYHAAWNNSGFGSNDPGRKRDGQEPSNFDRLHPIDISLPLAFVPAGTINCRNLLGRLQAELPYTFRFEKRAHQPDLAIAISIPSPNMSLDSILRIVISTLNSVTTKWQATILHGRVILYPRRKVYTHCQAII